MGFAASQARLLLLTARKSNLEFRAQQITNAEMMLAMRSEEIASKYSRAISNQTVKVLDGNKEVKITKESLAALGYRVMVKNGKNGYAGEWDTTWASDEEAGRTVVYKFNEGKFNQYCKDNNIDETTKGSYLNGIDGVGKSIEASKWTGEATVNGSKIDITDFYDEVVTQTKEYSTSGTDIGVELLDGINRGQLAVVNENDEEVSIHNGTGFVVCYDTSDDEAADAEYRKETAAIQVKEKRLQMEMKQVEAQQKACENEIESAKKLQDKNADSMFKYMS